MRYLFVSAQLAGHLDWGGYLRTGAALAHRGHTILWASGQEVAALVSRAGVPFHAMSQTGWRWPPPPPLHSSPNSDAKAIVRMKQIRALDQWLDVERVTAASTELIALAHDFQPDYIVSEMFTGATGIAAEALDIPFVVVGWPAPASSTAHDDMVQNARLRLERLTEHFKIRGSNWTPSGPPALLSPLLHLTYWSDSWFTGVKMSAQTRHVGGKTPGRSAVQPEVALLPSANGAPWVLITLGTSFNHDPNFFLAASWAVEQIGCIPIIALGTSKSTPWVQKILARLPHTAIVQTQFDFSALLPSVAAAVHHGGAGTTHALVSHAIPQIVVPHAADQMRQAQGIMRSGVGFAIQPKKVTTEHLVTALAAVLPDRSTVRGKAQLLQEEFDLLGGIPAAADILESLVKKR